MLTQIDEKKMCELEKIAEKRYEEKNILLTDRQKDSIYYQLLGIYQREGFEKALYVANNAMLHTKETLKKC